MEYVADRQAAGPSLAVGLPPGVFTDGPGGLYENGLPVGNNTWMGWNPLLWSHLTLRSDVICFKTYHSDMVELENGP